MGARERDNLNKYIIKHQTVIHMMKESKAGPRATGCWRGGLCSDGWAEQGGKEAMAPVGPARRPSDLC